jgi:hypothetical protein
MYCCFRRDLHFSWSMLKETAEEDSPAEYVRMGMETIPKDRVPVPIERAAMTALCHSSATP